MTLGTFFAIGPPWLGEPWPPYHDGLRQAFGKSAIGRKNVPLRLPSIHGLTTDARGIIPSRIAALYANAAKMTAACFKSSGRMRSIVSMFV